MCAKVNKLSELQLGVLALFTRGYDCELYIREVGALLGVSSRTALVVLESLERRTVLESTTRGKIRVYRLKKGFIVRDYLLLAETYKRILFFERQVLIKDVVERLAPLIDGVACIFGSYAKGLEKDGSDLDVFVAGTRDADGIRDLSRLYGVKINVKAYPFGLFAEKFREDVLLREVLNDHIMIKGAERLLEVVL